MLSNEGVNTTIFRIVHVDNLELILKNGMVSPNSNNASQTYKNIGNIKLISDRGLKQIPIEPYGSLNDYVPFYFAPRSPMPYSIINSNDFDDKQENIIHLLSNIRAIQQCGNNFVFTEMHAKAALANFYSELDKLNEIDWALMDEKYWNNTAEDNNRMHRRMAEFLVYNFGSTGFCVGSIFYHFKIKLHFFRPKINCVKKFCGVKR